MEPSESVRGVGKSSQTLQGLVAEALPNELFRVECEGGGRDVLAMVGVSLRHVCIKVLPGDRVTVEVSPYDPGRGRIVSRH